MTEFEMAYLLTDMQVAISTSNTVTLTIVSGFLVASYVAAHKLNRLMVWLLVGVYSYWWVGAAGLQNRQMVTYMRLLGKMHAFAAEGKGLEWHSAASIPSQGLLDAGPVVALLFNLTVFAASIVFFFQCRREGQKADTAATVQPTAATSA
jgi:hypothetical protein